ncbi:MAG: hypothetical protein Q8L87_01910 [Anaerolineales bacterium]|nr:hypothetical protein [Anaerolineales bacterium]
MNEYQFTLKFSIKSPATGIDAITEALGHEGCTDALLGIGQAGFISLDFTREALSAAEAVKSAIADVKRAIPEAQLVDVTPEPAHLGSH